MNATDKWKSTKYQVNGHEIYSKKGLLAKHGTENLTENFYIWKQGDKYFRLRVNSPHEDEYLELCDAVAYPLNLTAPEKIDKPNTPSLTVKFSNSMNQAAPNLVVSFFKANKYNGYTDIDLLYKGSTNSEGVITVTEDFLSSHNQLYMLASSPTDHYGEYQKYILNCDDIKKNKQLQFSVKWISISTIKE